MAIDAKRELRLPEVVRSLKETDHLSRSRNSKQKETFVQTVGLGILRNTSRGHM